MSKSSKWPANGCSEILASGFTISDILRDFGTVCDVIADLTFEKRAPIAMSEFQALDLSLDDAIAEAITEHGKPCRPLTGGAAIAAQGEVAPG